MTSVPVPPHPPDRSPGATGTMLTEAFHTTPDGVYRMRTGYRPGSTPEHIRTILDALFKQKGIEEAIRAHRAVALWNAMTEEPIARHAKAVCVERDTLIVEVDSPGWMHRLQIEESNWRRRINQSLDTNRIRRIRFRLGSIESPRTENPE